MKVKIYCLAFQLVGFLEAKSPVCQLSYHHRPIILQINREMYFYLGLDVKLQQEIYREMRQRAQVQKLSQSNFYFSSMLASFSDCYHNQAWIKNKVDLIGTSIYGIR